MKYLSLFTGIGGFELGILSAYENIRNNRSQVSGQSSVSGSRNLSVSFENDGGNWWKSADCIGYSEIDPYATQIYRKYFPEHKNYGDITKIIAEELPDFDLLVGGFPCQAFSIAGKRNGFNDTRGTLFFYIARILNIKRPKLFLLENVKGLLSHDSGRTFNVIISTLDELGYDTQWQVLNSKNHGVPQSRERVFIVGSLRGERRPKVFPFGESDSNDIQGNRERENSYAHTIDTKGGSNARGTFLTDGSKLRKLTPVECERLQGFPDNWTQGVSDTQRYKTLGNAVTVNVVRDILEKIITQI